MSAAGLQLLARDQRERERERERERTQTEMFGLAGDSAQAMGARGRPGKRFCLKT